MGDRTGQHFGNYRLVRLLGQGGYAEVYLGQHLRLTQQAAIKVLHAHLTESEAEHFQQEAQTISTLVHPSIIRVFDYDVQDGVPFLVMDYAPNGSLRQRYPKGSLVPLPTIVSSMKQIADALQYAHEQKVIHRDVKPENMLLGRRDEVLLSDFGIATIAHSSGSLSTKEAVGTLSYMAPEQIEGHPRAASDQYALGIVVYEWLCGARPFEGSPTEVMVQQLSMPPPPLHEQVATVPLEVEQVVLRALAKDPKARFATVHNFATALEQASQRAYSPTALIPGEQPVSGLPVTAAFATLAVPSAAPPALVASVSPETPAEPATPPGQAGKVALTATTPAAPFAATTPAGGPLLPESARLQRRRTIAGLPAALLIGLVVLIVAGSILGSLSLLAHFGVIGARSGPTTTIAVRGGTWIYELPEDIDSLIPNSSGSAFSAMVDQALYLPLFYGDAQGVIHPGAASEVPSLQNGGISPDVKTWTFHLRPHLVWSDGAPYDARDVDFTWKLWLNPKFGAGSTAGFNLITSADVSADNLSITFHLKQAYVPFYQLWVDGIDAPLPAHHFSRVAPEQILKSPDNRNPQVTSGPFMMAEGLPADRYTLVRNPKYYLASEGLPYLDKVVFRIVPKEGAILKDLQDGSIDSAYFPAVGEMPQPQHLTHYTSISPATSTALELLLFNFHNTVLASHPEVRQAIAMAIDQQALIQAARHGFATAQCTDHGSFFHPGYDATAPCPLFDPAVANQLLDDDGWVRGPDGVRTRNGQRLEFEYSTATIQTWSVDGEAIIASNLRAIGIKLDIQNYPDPDVFYGPFLNGGKASPPTGAVAGRYDIAEIWTSFGYDPDDSSLLSCDQFPPNGTNFDFYCNHALDTLYQQELMTPDPGLRQQVFIQIHRIYLTDFPFIVLYSPTENWMVRKGTHNYSPSTIGGGETINIWQWWCDNGKC